jgi:hypothetical protein
MKISLSRIVHNVAIRCEACLRVSGHVRSVGGRLIARGMYLAERSILPAGLFA